MTKARLLSTVAVTLLLTAGIASAQAPKQDEAPARAPAAQQNAPAEKIAPAMKPGEHKAGAEQKAPATTTGQAPKASDADKTRATDNKGGAMDKTLEKDKAADKGAPKSSSEVDVKTKANDNAQAPASAKPAQSTEKSSTTTTTTGQGAAAGSAKLSTEQRTQITTVIKQQKVERVEPSKLNVSISIGTRIPDRGVRFHPLPREVFVIYPEWRGYDYILVGDQIVVVNPRTHEIVAILDA